MAALLMGSASGATKSATAVLPSLDHLRMEDYDNVYEPAEDTYLMCDALLQDRPFILAQPPRLVLEIGSGSGCNITYLTSLINAASDVDADGEGDTSEPLPGCVSIATDINPYAVSCTERTAAANNCSNIQVVQTDLITGLEDTHGVAGAVDVLVFNPPYVPTPDEEVGTADVAAAWAGGKDGRRVIDRFLPLLPLLLTKPTSTTADTETEIWTETEVKGGGRCYLVLVEENKPAEIAQQLRRVGLLGEIVLRRRARNEGLLIMRITWLEVQV